jgi:hypothetical protein
MKEWMDNKKELMYASRFGLFFLDFLVNKPNDDSVRNVLNILSGNVDNLASESGVVFLELS